VVRLGVEERYQHGRKRVRRNFMTASPFPADSAQPDVPNAARIYSYTLGGTHYFPVDQAAAEYMFSLVPSTPKWVRMLRAFLQQAARQLWAEGFTHFVDFASGLPTEDHIHHVLPDAKIVYSDSDPATYAQAQAMVGHLPNVLYVQHDVRDARSRLESAQVRDFLDGERKVAIGLSGITVFLTAAANAFLATLSDTEQDSVLFDWTDNTQKQRWSNLPRGCMNALA